MRYQKYKKVPTQPTAPPPEPDWPSMRWFHSNRLISASEVERGMGMSGDSLRVGWWYTVEFNGRYMDAVFLGIDYHMEPDVSDDYNVYPMTTGRYRSSSRPSKHAGCFAVPWPWGGEWLPIMARPLNAHGSADRVRFKTRF